MLERLADLGMQIAERVAVEAKETPKTQAEPQVARRPDPVITFARITRCVRETLSLEARIAAGNFPAAPHEKSETNGGAERETNNDPRRPLIKNFISELIETTPLPKSIKAGFRNQLDPLITENLQADPEQDQAAGAIVLDICEELGLPCSTSQMPDELLTRPHRSITEAERNTVAAEVYRRIHGHDPP